MTRRTLQDNYLDLRDIHMALDVSRVEPVSDNLVDRCRIAIDAMERLEAGEPVNIDENRMVGHYWMRDPGRAPQNLGQSITETVNRIRAFVDAVHRGDVRPQQEEGFFILLLVGIGGSALGPQLLADALGDADDLMLLKCIDNTDPDGIDRILDEIGDNLAATMTLVVSKSGGTAETRNGMLEVAERYRQAGLDFARHAVAVTMTDSKLDRQATEEKWLARFPIWDHVGGRTSVTGAVGLLPAALLGFDTEQFLQGAAEADEVTRQPDPMANPAAQLAMALFSCRQRGKRNLVVLPYSDRLSLLTRYLQQLVMESLGKAVNRQGDVVAEGVSVLGNKGSTDQHALVQQLREGPDDCLLLFVGVRKTRSAPSIAVSDTACTSDFLHAFLLGTRTALTDAGRESMTLMLDSLDERMLGSLIALFERTVGIYAELANINAYHQPGVEAGKNSAGEELALRAAIVKLLAENGEDPLSAREVATRLQCDDRLASIYEWLAYLVHQPEIIGQPGIRVVRGDAAVPFDAPFRLQQGAVVNE